MEQNSQQKTRVTAVVAPGSANNGRYKFNHCSWELSDNSLTMLFSREFELDTDNNTLIESIEELQKIILALFLTDSIPRKIFCFEYGENIPPPDLFNLWQVFGVPRTHLESEQIINALSISRIGTHIYDHPLDFVADESAIKSWFEFLSQYPKIASSLQLIQESYGLIYDLSLQMRITNFAEFSTVVLLLVSGLESIFTRSDDNHADISFKFRTVGAAFYSRYVNNKTFAFDVDFGTHPGKFSYKDFNQILGVLYNLRSSIAHGGFGFNFFDNKKIRGYLDKLFMLVGLENRSSRVVKSLYFTDLTTALRILEKHILEIFRTAKGNLDRGVEILDDMLEDEN